MACWQFQEENEGEPAAFARALGKRIHRLRVGTGLTQGDLADRLGICREMLSRYERGLNAPRLYLLLRICTFLFADPAALLSDLLPFTAPPLPASSRLETRSGAGAGWLAGAEDRR